MSRYREDNKDPRMGYYYVVRKMFGEETRVGGEEARGWKISNSCRLLQFCREIEFHVCFLSGRFSP